MKPRSNRTRFAARSDEVADATNDSRNSEADHDRNQSTRVLEDAHGSASYQAAL